VDESVGLLARIRRRDGVPEGSGHGRARARAAEERAAPLPFLLAVLGWTPRDAVGFVVGTAAVAAILGNVLFMQPGSHPAPLFKPPELEPNRAQPAAKPAAAAPPQRLDLLPAAATPKLLAPHAPRTPGEIITDVQRELARRGYYDGPVDGLYGPRTDGAIRDFERAAGLKPSAQPTEALLQAITRSPVRPGKGVTGSTPVTAAGTLRAAPPAQSGSTPSRVAAVQRALSEFGYGQIKPSGTLDSDTQRAIAAFERQRNLPITGQLSDQLVRELGAATGRTIE
jgi:peptidoglycan hydrolase-like protein with peptidoglycan-binding domain